MPQLNRQGPNPPLDQFSRAVEGGVDKLSNLRLDNTTGAVGRYLSGRLSLLRTMVDDLDQPILKGLGSEMLSVMSNWFSDPETLCCLIQGIWSAYQDSLSNKNQKLPSTTNLSIADTKFADFLDSMISFIDLIIAFLTQDLRRLVLFIPDFIKELFGAVMGAILVIIQEVLFSLRNSVINTILEWIDDKAKIDGIWAQCFPMQKLLDIIKKYIHDYGLLAEINEKIKGYVSGLTSKWSLTKSAELVPNVTDLEYLFWLREILIKLKQATINFDLCVEYSFVPGNLSDDDKPQRTVNKVSEIIRGDAGEQNASKKALEVDVISLDDGTIAVNKSPNSAGDRGEWRARISKDSIIDFGVNYLGYPREVLENAYTKATSDDQGTVLGPDSDAQDRCPGFTRAAQLLGFRRGI